MTGSQNLSASGGVDVILAEFRSNDGAKLNVTSLVTRVEITQGIDQPGLRVIVTFLDLAGAIEKFPVIGEEQFAIELRSNDFSISRTILLHTASIDSIETLENNKGLRYTITFVGVHTFFSGLRRVTTSYSAETSEMAKDLFQKGFTSFSPQDLSALSNKFGIRTFDEAGHEFFDIGRQRFFAVEKTYGNVRCIVPKYSPIEAMSLFASKSYSVDSPSCSFSFFETLDGYYFSSNEGLTRIAEVNNIKKRLIYSNSIDSTPEGLHLQKYKIVSLKQPTRINVGEEISSGVFANKVKIIDIVKRDVYDVEFFWKDAKFSIPSPYHTDDFVENNFNTENAREFIHVRDYDDIEMQIKGNQHTAEIISNRVSYDFMVRNSAIMVKALGRLDICPGNVVDIEVLEFNKSYQKQSNEYLSGSYLVNSTVHSLVQGKMEVTMQLFKVS